MWVVRAIFFLTSAVYAAENQNASLSNENHLRTDPAMVAALQVWLQEPSSPLSLLLGISSDPNTPVSPSADLFADLPDSDALTPVHSPSVERPTTPVVTQKPVLVVPTLRCPHCEQQIAKPLYRAHIGIEVTSNTCRVFLDAHASDARKKYKY